MPYKWNEERRYFQQKGKMKGVMIAVGLEGNSVMRGKNGLSYGWDEGERKWRNLSGDRVKNIVTGCDGRLFKTDWSNFKIL